VVVEGYVDRKHFVLELELANCCNDDDDDPELMAGRIVVAVVVAFAVAFLACTKPIAENCRHKEDNIFLFVSVSKESTINQ
jgi:hypothetical protein